MIVNIMNASSLRKRVAVAVGVLGAVACSAAAGWWFAAYEVHPAIEVVATINAWVFPSQLPDRTVVGTVVAAIVLFIVRQPKPLPPLRPGPQLMIVVLTAAAAVSLLWATFPPHAYSRQGPLDPLGTVARYALLVAFGIWASTAAQAVLELIQKRPNSDQR